MTNYRKNGYQWEITAQNEYKAIATNGTHWEVFYLQHNQERVIAGVTIAASITPPGNEQWGSEGWTFMSLNNAWNKYNELQPKMKEATND